jgi:RNA polymerase subunit RPABC4/transcription elongation factor Spt4
VYTCRDCDTKYCEDDGPPCPECGSSDYSEDDKVYA